MTYTFLHTSTASMCTFAAFEFAHDHFVFFGHKCFPYGTRMMREISLKPKQWLKCRRASGTFFVPVRKVSTTQGFRYFLVEKGAFRVSMAGFSGSP